MTITTPTTWLAAPAPGICKTISPALIRAMRDALHDVDLDIERYGAVTAETVDKVRDVRAQLRA